MKTNYKYTCYRVKPNQQLTSKVSQRIHLIYGIFDKLKCKIFVRKLLLINK